MLFAHVIQGLAHAPVGAHGDELRVHQAAGAVLGVGEQGLQDLLVLHREHLHEQLGVLVRQLVQQGRGIVVMQLADQPRLVLVLQGVEHLGLLLGAQVGEYVGGPLGAQQVGEQAFTVLWGEIRGGAGDVLVGQLPQDATQGIPVAGGDQFRQVLDDIGFAHEIGFVRVRPWAG